MEGPVAGARELAGLLGAPVFVEEPWPAPGRWEADLQAAGPMLAAARDAVAGGATTLVGSSCDIAITTLRAAAARHPGLRVAWLDAHPDFNTPASSGSGFLGGMPLAAACGVWDAGFDADAPLDPARVHLLGIRDVDAGERALLDAQGVSETAPADGPVWVHLDLDVLDPAHMPAAFPVPGGWDWERLGIELRALPDVVGIEITGCAPGYAGEVAQRLSPVIVRT